MLRIAITGGIAEGKSTVLNYIKEYGIPAISADDIARQVLSEELFQHRVAEALHVHLPLDRAEIRSKILDDPLAREKLNYIVHPEILKRLLDSGVQVIEVPLLFEAGVQDHFEKIWVVTCGLAEQKRRLAERLQDSELAQKLISIQLPSSKKCEQADVVFDTRKPEDTVKRQVRDALASEGFFKNKDCLV